MSCPRHNCWPPCKRGKHTLQSCGAVAACGAADSIFVWRKYFFVVFTGEDASIGFYFDYKVGLPAATHACVWDWLLAASSATTWVFPMLAAG